MKLTDTQKEEAVEAIEAYMHDLKNFEEKSDDQMEKLAYATKHAALDVIRDRIRGSIGIHSDGVICNISTSQRLYLKDIVKYRFEDIVKQYQKEERPEYKAVLNDEASYLHELASKLLIWHDDDEVKFTDKEKK